MRVSAGHAGTLGYMAPEVEWGKPYGTKSDVYAFGICLWEIYCCDNISDHLFKTKPTIPADCPKSLAQLIERCWDTDPKKRPAMKDVVVELEEMVKSEEWKTSPEDEHSTGGFGCFGPLFKNGG
uniref:dual specificity protein kinase shkA-like n=1 Tax=Erigeron canadensis TaxID=72917 RepID=UPI001CB91A41|nr:dual specificity protein kinase shkA-like [Erigeron canadensis]